MQIADVLYDIDQSLSIDIYGNAAEADQVEFNRYANIRYHGFVSAQSLHGILERSDILLHVESFREAIASKLQYAFSTKIAQYLCACRPLLCYAPAGSASSEYLRQENGALVAANVTELKIGLTELIRAPALRAAYAERARRLGLQNHNREITAAFVKREIDSLL